MESEVQADKAGWRAPAGWALLAAGLIAAYAHNFREMWVRWYPSWHRAELGLYDKIVGGRATTRTVRWCRWSAW